MEAGYIARYRLNPNRHVLTRERPVVESNPTMTPHGRWMPGGWRDFKRDFMPFVLVVAGVTIVGLLMTLLWR